MTLINERIRYPEVRVVAEGGALPRVMATRDAIELARDQGFGNFDFSGAEAAATVW